MQQPAQAAAQGSAPEQKTARPGISMAELPKAIPEDVSNIVANWPTLVGQTAMPMKLYLKRRNSAWAVITV